MLRTTFSFGQGVLLPGSTIIGKNRIYCLKTVTNLKINECQKSDRLENLINLINLNGKKCNQLNMNSSMIGSSNRKCSKEWLKNLFKQDRLCSLERIHRKNVYNWHLYPTMLGENHLKTVVIAANQKRTCSTFCGKETHTKQSNSVAILSTSSDTEKLYIAPKNVLHNAYNTIAQELNNRDLQLQPHFNVVKEKKNNHSWCCTYHIKWPEAIKFVSVGRTKQEASHKAALAALTWLRKNEKITKEGHPILFGKKEQREFAQKAVPHLSLDNSVLQEIKAISQIYEGEFVSKLSENLTKEKQQGDETTENSDWDEPDDINLKTVEQKLFASDKYFAKEKVHLPISDYKQEFINLLAQHRAVIIQGEPGCGKSTRIPQYVLESWAREGLAEGDPCRIAVTQPRRIAAVSLAARVANERDEYCGHIIGYHVRLKSKFNPNTGRILYCTTGILLRHLQSDLTLSNFTHVILDEAHERDVNTDLLMNLLRNSLQQNPNLKLIVMSATIDTDLFKNYFNGAPVMHVPGFTYTVKPHFLNDLPELDLSKSLKMCQNDFPSVIHEDVVKVIKFLHKTKSEGAILCFLPGWEDISRVEKLIPKSNDMSVLCLHSRLQDSDQWKIFSKAPPGIRKVILSTNIAETSITINDVVYVIDTGIHKENRFDNTKGIMCIDNYWIAQSNMIQRKGRAGRVQPGESFHLYTKSKFESFAKFSDPEILKTSLTKIVLNSKVYSNNMDALKFMSQLPSPPDKSATERAVGELKELELLDDNEILTPLGKTLANFQLEPKLAKVLVNAVVYKCVTPVVDIVTLFSADTELFARSLFNKENIKYVKSKSSKYSDHLAIMRLFETWLDLMETRGEAAAQAYCFESNLVHHKLVTMSKLRKIHFDYLYDGLYGSLAISDDYSDNDELVKAVLLSGVGTLLKHRDWDFIKGSCKKKNVFLTNFNQKASITSESVNFKRTSFPSELLIYLNEVRSNIRKTTVIRECSVISPLAVLLFSPKALLTKKVEDNEKLILSLKNTKVEFLCTKEEFDSIRKCKEALNSAYQYFIYQMTEGGESCTEVNAIWDKILERVNRVLSKCSI